jgi:transposase
MPTGLIVYHEVTSEPNDTRQLYPMAKATKNTLGVSNLTVVADAGYSSGMAAAACEADGITACVPTNRSIHSQGDGTLFGRSAFVYTPEADTYICPAGHVLARKQEVMRRDHMISMWRATAPAAYSSLDVPPQSVALSVAISMRMRWNE